MGEMILNIKRKKRIKYSPTIFVIFILLCAMLCASIVNAQVKIGNNVSTIDASSLLELETTNKGVLLPRVSLSAQTTWGLAGATPVDGMTVFNSNAAATGISGTGIVIWRNSKWNEMLDQSKGWMYDGNIVGSVKSIGTNDNFDLPFETNGTERMRLTSAGNFVIGATTASAKFHIAGTTSSSAIGTTGLNLVGPTIRIEGLGSTNNTVHQAGDTEPRPLYVSRNGDLVVAPSCEVLQNVNNYISNAATVAVGSATGALANAKIYNVSFTLTRRAVVTFTYSASYQMQTNTLGVITDGLIRFVRSYMKIKLGAATVKDLAGYAGQTYSNGLGGIGAVISGFGALEGHYTIELTPGSYTLELYGECFGSASASTRATFGGSSNEDVQIVAFYR